MRVDHPSRRNLLTGFVAGLFGWFFPRPGQAAPRPPKKSRPKPFAIRGPWRDGLVTITTYDGQGRCIALRQERGAPRPGTVVGWSPEGPVTTYFYG